MIRRIRKLKIALHERYPESRLDPLNADAISRLQSRLPKIPAYLLQFFAEIGCGSIGESRYMIHDHIPPGDVFDEEIALKLEGVLLIGDDFAGTCEAYDKWTFGSIGSRGEFKPHSEYATFLDFLEDWFLTEA